MLLKGNKNIHAQIILAKVGYFVTQKIVPWARCLLCWQSTQVQSLGLQMVSLAKAGVSPDHH